MHFDPSLWPICRLGSKRGRFFKQRSKVYIERCSRSAEPKTRCQATGKQPINLSCPPLRYYSQLLIKGANLIKKERLSAALNVEATA
jgi:hypothetical protein